MKAFIKIAILLSTFFTITVCNVLSPALTPTTSPSIREVVIPTQMTDEIAIRAALAAHLGANANELTVVIEQNTSTHAKGGVDNGYFLADGQAMPDCQAVANHNFPSSMVPECQGSSGEVNAIKDALHLSRLANTDREITLELAGPVTQRTILDAIEAQYPLLRGTIRYHTAHERRLSSVFLLADKIGRMNLSILLYQTQW